jgi:hypothetical protein
VDETGAPYAYAADNPVDVSDPLGLSPDCATSDSDTYGSSSAEVELLSYETRARPTVGLWQPEPLGLRLTAGEGIVEGTAFATAKVMSDGHALAKVIIVLTNSDDEVVSSVTKYVDKYNNQATFEFTELDVGEYRVTATFSQEGVTVVGAARLQSVPIEVSQPQKEANSQPLLPLQPMPEPTLL